MEEKKKTDPRARLCSVPEREPIEPHTGKEKHSKHENQKKICWFMEEKNASSNIPDSYGEGMVFPKMSNCCFKIKLAGCNNS